MVDGEKIKKIGYYRLENFQELNTDRLLRHYKKIRSILGLLRYDIEERGYDFCEAQCEELKVYVPEVKAELDRREHVFQKGRGY